MQLLHYSKSLKGLVQMKIVGIFALIAMTLVAACDQRAMIDKMTPQAEDAFAKHFVELIQKRDFAAVEKQFEDGALTDEQRQRIPSLAATIPVDPPLSIVTEGVHTSRNAAGVTTELSYQYEFPDRWLGIDLTIAQKPNFALQIQGLNIARLPGSLKEINAFRFGGRPLSAYLIAGMTVIVILFIVVSAIVCLLTPRPRWWWKLVWCLAMFVGLSRFTVNWTNGKTGLVPINLDLPDAWIGRLGPDGPFYFQVAIPIGAIVYWMWRQGQRPPTLP
jgi:hypothetical protein